MSYFIESGITKADRSTFYTPERHFLKLSLLNALHGVQFPH